MFKVIHLTRMGESRRDALFMFSMELFGFLEQFVLALYPVN